MSAILPCIVDHLVVGATSLERGCTFVADLLGERPVSGGVHPHMGTHNALLSLGGSVYLEVIAIDPQGKAPAWPRWFSLDNEQTRATLANSPRLLTWVASTTQITALSQLTAYRGCEAKPMSRAHLKWQFAFTADGNCLAGGLLPYVIQWQGPAHPSDSLPPSDCMLTGLQGVSPDAHAINRTLGQMALSDTIRCKPSHTPGTALSALIDTPRGSVRL